MRKLDRRAFLRQSGANALGLAVLPPVVGAAPPESPASLTTPLPGPWNIAVDHQDIGLKAEWYRRAPSGTAALVPVRVPGCVQEYVPGFPGGRAWYFTSFGVSATTRKRLLRLKFWAVNYAARVWLNGSELGGHEGGYTPFEFDVTDRVRRDRPNYLAIRVVDPPRQYRKELAGYPGWENTTDGTVDEYTFGEIPSGPQHAREGLKFSGIWQPVELLDSDPWRVADLFIEPDLAAGKAIIHAQIANANPSAGEGRLIVRLAAWREPRTELCQAEASVPLDEAIFQATLPMEIRHPRAWSPDDPYLYLAEASLYRRTTCRHTARARFGLRDFTVENGFFHLNGERIFVRGSHHQGTYPGTLVYPPSREFAFDEIRTFKEAGFNFIRVWIHPPAQALLDAADELGILLQLEPPLGKMKIDERTLPRAVREVEEMVRRDRNRPSVVVWNMVNEQAPAISAAAQLCAAARRLDSSRLITESAGGPSRYYLPRSAEGHSYLTEHPYLGGPMAEEVYAYLSRRGWPGQLFFLSEYGFGGLCDIDAVLERYGDHPKKFMEDYRGFARLREIWRQNTPPCGSNCPPFKSLMVATQKLQCDLMRLHTQALRANPSVGGYVLVQMFDSNAFELDGFVDFWRNKRKLAFAAVQDLNRPLALVVQRTPMNLRARQTLEVSVTLVNERQIAGPRALVVRFRTESGETLAERRLPVRAEPWVSTIFRGDFQAPEATGRYSIEAVLLDGERTIVRGVESCCVLSDDDLKWPSRPVAVLEESGRLRRYLADRDIPHRSLSLEVNEPAAILVEAEDEILSRPAEYKKFLWLRDHVERGCTAVFFRFPDTKDEGVEVPVNNHGFLSAFAPDTALPFVVGSANAGDWGAGRTGPFSGGIGEPFSWRLVPKHPLFEGFQPDGLMGVEFGNVMPLRIMGTPVPKAETVGNMMFSVAHGKGRFLFCSLHLLPHLKSDAIAEKLLCNLVRHADRLLPAKLDPSREDTREQIRSRMANYEDCLGKYGSPGELR